MSIASAPSSAAGQAASTGSQVSALARLKTVPAIFRGASLTVKFGWEAKTASHYLWLWKKRGLVAPLGGHSDAFANLLVDSNPNWEAALMMARPSAVIVGVECLRREGWTTQVPRKPEIVIDVLLPIFSTTHFDVEQRAASWYQTVAPGITRERNGGGLPDNAAPILRPSWALADMLGHRGWGACGLSPDDVEWSEIGERDRRDWRRATRALGLSEEVADNLAPDLREDSDAVPRERDR